jgi:hypothetical protein
MLAAISQRVISHFVALMARLIEIVHLFLDLFEVKLFEIVQRKACVASTTEPPF